MPNWCENSVTIEGNEQIVDKIKEFVRNEESAFSLDNIIPMPNGEWDYDWCVANWNTKWDVRSMLREQSKSTSVTYVFDSAWAPPQPVIAELASKFPSVVIRHAYDEPGMDFGGYDVYYRGELVDKAEGGSKCTTWDEMASWVTVDKFEMQETL